MTATRNGWIDVLRALSAMAVVLFHFNAVPLQPAGPAAAAWHGLWQYGHLGVGVFFALSGYCLIPGWQRSAGCLDFMRRRVWRILPPYWASLLLIAVLALGFKLTTGVNDIATLPRDPVSLAATLLLFTQPVTGVPTMNWVYWTLSDMLAFYALMTLPLLAPRPARVFILLGLHTLLCTADLAFRPVPAGIFFFIRHWPVFGVGAALGVWSIHRSAAAAMLVASFLHAVVTIGRGYDHTHYLLTGWLTVAAVTVTLAANLPAALRPLARLGTISYSLYLIHVPVGILALSRLFPQSMDPGWEFIGRQLVLLTVCLAAAGLFYFAGERPFLNPPRLRLSQGNP